MSRTAGWLVPLFGFVVAMGFALLKVSSTGADPRHKAYEAAWDMVAAIEAGEFAGVAGQFAPDASVQLRSYLQDLSAHAIGGTGFVHGVRIDPETGDVLVGLLVAVGHTTGGVYELRYRPTQAGPRLIGLERGAAYWGP